MPDLLAKFITGQSAHETAGWSSSVFQECNNGFGYKWVGQTTAAGECLNHPGYAAYYNIEQSVTELTKWIKRRQTDGRFPANLNSITTAGEYANLLKASGYFEDSLTTYTNGIINWLSRISIKGAVAGGGILVIGVIAYVFRKDLKKLFAMK